MSTEFIRNRVQVESKVHNEPTTVTKYLQTCIVLLSLLQLGLGAKHKLLFQVHSPSKTDYFYLP
jgi:hypothetical protein